MREGRLSLIRVPPLICRGTGLVSVGRRSKANVATLAYAHVHRPAPRVHSIMPAVPEYLDVLVAALLQKDPSKRPQSAAEVEAALQRVDVNGEIAAGIATEPLT